LHARLVVRLRRLARLVEATALAVEQPAVIAAAQSVLFHAAELERSATVAAIAVQQAEPALEVAEQDELLAEQLDRHRRLLHVLG
jgi:hypothetical protein